MFKTHLVEVEQPGNRCMSTRIHSQFPSRRVHNRDGAGRGALGALQGRLGQGQVMRLDRRFSYTLQAAKFYEDDEEAKETMVWLEQQSWYNDDDGFPPGPDGAEEHDCKLTNEHQTRYGPFLL